MTEFDLDAIETKAKELGLKTERLEAGSTGAWLHTQDSAGDLDFWAAGHFILSCSIQDVPSQKLVEHALRIDSLACQLLRAGRDVAQSGDFERRITEGT
jgi:hypothetical protein